VVIADLMMPGISGMDLLQSLKQIRPDLSVIMITGFPSIKTAVQAIRIGAFDYLPKPFTPDELRSLVQRALERKHIFETKEAVKPEFLEETLRSMTLPHGLYCIPEHSWSKVEQDGVVTIGVHHVFLLTTKKISSVTFPRLNEYINQGEVCLKITDSNMFIHKLWAPISGKIISINEQAKKSYTEILKDPYGNGWIVKITPLSLEEDLKNLITT
jgi:glycine cleavage system H lipoate-binding protein